MGLIKITYGEPDMRELFCCFVVFIICTPLNKTIQNAKHMKHFWVTNLTVMQNQNPVTKFSRRMSDTPKCRFIRPIQKLFVSGHLYLSNWLNFCLNICYWNCWNFYLDCNIWLGTDKFVARIRCIVYTWSEVFQSDSKCHKAPQFEYSWTWSVCSGPHFEGILMLLWNW